jgi:hypothetical protein
VQPVVAVAANGGARTEVKVGDPVELEVRAEAPPAGGRIVSVEWDFEGHGAFGFRHEVTGTEKSVLLSATHSYQAPGTYFATARVCAHRDGALDAEFRRLPNVASARVLVSG